jgi:hypothetical protein
MKQCKKCKQSYREDFFTKKSCNKNGLSARCKICTRKASKIHFLANKKYYFEKAKRNKKQIIEFLRETKDIPCKDCKNKYPYYVMDFDHKRNKKFGLCGSYPKKGKLQVLEEIKKCDVVCSNCHRIRTYKRRILSEAKLEKHQSTKLDG